jgi:hypothetical protein
MHRFPIAGNGKKTRHGEIIDKYQSRPHRQPYNANPTNTATSTNSANAPHVSPVIPPNR